MQPVVNVREVRPSDVAAVVALIRATLEEFGLRFGVGSATDDAVLALPGSYVEHGGVFWVVEDGEQLLGTCGLFPLRDGVYELRKMYLAPAARGLGLGQRLLAHAVSWCRSRGARHIVLDTVEEMSSAIEFYERNGFVRDDTQIRGSRCTRGYRLTL